MDEIQVIARLDPNKDVDCMHPLNIGLLMQGRSDFIPGTPGGIQQLLVRNGYSTNGKHVVICGRSNIVGKPLAILMLQKTLDANATVTVCHTGTPDLPSITKKADILVAAIGKPKVIRADMVKDGAIVVDVGINRIDDASKRQGYRLVGDVDFDGVVGKVAAITPVPGGVGPMTIAMLLVNTITAAKKRLG
jgi:methylenetetrahydrofolate dehydrogenase (NADP+)/methenyltetrahydrofolate cyclohydrolase